MAAADLDTINSTQTAGVQYLGQIVAALRAAFGFLGGTAPSATGGAATLPANPVGFVTMTLPSGASVKVPYYN
ncbi:MAG TPA: hypothetical protein VKQ27_04970 [Acetobacteraceae bacterium]|nr:hypothetical protein [Acetobacteraceae bacterium]